MPCGRVWSFFVADSEQWCLQYIHVTFFDQIREKLKEECEQQQSYVHAVDIGVSGDDDLIVAQGINAVFDIQRGL